MAMRNWIIGKVDEAKASECAKRWNVPKICAAVLISRGFENDEDVNKFLSLPEFFPPSEFSDMQKAADYLISAVENNEKICVYGDYDADGVTSTALLYSYLRSKGADVIYYIPDREKEGYGLNSESVRKLHEDGVKVLVTVDNGISAYDEVELAVNLGMKVIITDHHKLPEKLPPAHAIVDPCKEDWCDERKNFAGVGVAYKLVQTIEKSEDYLEYALLGTIGDSMPLFEQSRRIVKKGLEIFSDSKSTGIRILIESLKLKGKKLTATDLAFKIVPRINASGRMKSAEIALRLLTSDDENECKEICTELENLNCLRKSIEREILTSVEEKLRENPSKRYENIIIVEGEGWHHGIVGIAASKIVEKYGKPCILIAYSEGQARGSCRSIDGFSIYEAVSSCSEYLERFGGHTLAAGINLKAENIEIFSREVLIRSRQHDFEFPSLSVDLEIEPEDFSFETADAFECLEPFGNGNPEPVFCMTGLRLLSFFSIGDGSHIKLSFLANGNKKIEMLYFGKAKKDFLYTQGDILDAAFTMHKNVFRSRVSVSAYVVDLKPSAVNMPEAVNLKKIYEKFKRGEDLTSSEAEALIPSREEFAGVYRYLVRFSGRTRPDILSYKIFGDTSHCGKVYTILDVFEEMNLMNIFWDADEFTFYLNKGGEKVNLNDSETIILLNKMKEGLENGRI